MLRSMLPAWSTPRLGTLLRTNEEMDRLFDRFFTGANEGAISQSFLPLSIWEGEEQLHIEAEVPGASIDDIELVFHDGALRLSYSRQAPEKERTYWLNERSYGRFERTLRLPEGVDPDSVKAELNAGVLHVTLGKRPELQARKIAVQAGSSSQQQPVIEGKSRPANGAKK